LYDDFHGLNLSWKLRENTKKMKSLLAVAPASQGRRIKISPLSMPFLGDWRLAIGYQLSAIGGPGSGHR
jgi:hypothetical protein